MFAAGPDTTSSDPCRPRSAPPLVRTRRPPVAAAEPGSRRAAAGATVQCPAPQAGRCAARRNRSPRRTRCKERHPRCHVLVDPRASSRNRQLARRTGALRRQVERHHTERAENRCCITDFHTGRRRGSCRNCRRSHSLNIARRRRGCRCPKRLRRLPIRARRRRPARDGGHRHPEQPTGGRVVRQAQVLDGVRARQRELDALPVGRVQHDRAGRVAGRLQLGQALAQRGQHRLVAYACVWIPLVALTSASTLASTASLQPVVQLVVDERLQGAVVEQPEARDPLGEVRDDDERCPRRGSRSRPMVGLTAPSATTAALLVRTVCRR